MDCIFKFMVNYTCRMMEQRNTFINEMNDSFISHTKKFHSILTPLGWTRQSVSGPIKEERGKKSGPEAKNSSGNEQFVKGELKGEGHNRQDTEVEGCSFSLNGIQSWICDKRRTLCLGASRDCEKRYKELLASLSFQPKLKKERLSDKQFLASLLESERNAKRRRISYKNRVHTKNKSNTEVLREVIREQMEVLKGNEEENAEGSKCGSNGEKPEDDEMVEIRVMDGNPHLAWQTVGLVMKEQKEKAKYQENRRQERCIPDYRPSDSGYRKHHSSGHHSKRHRSSSNYRDRSPNHHSSRYSHSDRITQGKSKSSRRHSHHSGRKTKDR